MLHCNLNFNTDSSNLLVEFSQVFEQARRDLSKFGGRGCMIRRNNKRSRPEPSNPEGARKRAGNGLEHGTLEFRQVLGAAREGAQLAGLGKEIADLVGGHGRAMRGDDGCNSSFR